MTVWVVNTVSWSLDSALQFGDLRYINGKYIYADALLPDGGIPNGFFDNMVAAVEQFDPSTDYLLIVGDHLQLLQMTALLTHAYSKFRALRYDRQAQGYFPVTIEA